MGSCASLPTVERTQKQSLSDDSFDCSIYATQGRRPRMEDRHTACLSFPNHPHYSLFGVFDGFNGADASSYLSQNIVNTLDTIPNLEDNDAIAQAIEELDTKYIHCEKTDENTNDPAAGTTFTFALIHAIDSEDASTANDSSPSYTISTASECASEYESLKSGTSTADMPSVAVTNGYHVRIFWAGDSRAVLMSDCYKFRNLTEDHNCSSQKEAKRITEAKGTIINNRVDGVCEVARCFGCYQMKSDASLPINKQKMISTPECTTLFCKKNDRLFLFSDGVIKKWTDNQFNARCKHHVMQHKDEKNGNLYALEYLCEQAIDEGSRDNITILSVQFK